MSKLKELIKELTTKIKDDQFNHELQAIIDEACREQRTNCITNIELRVGTDDWLGEMLAKSPQPETGIK